MQTTWRRIERTKFSFTSKKKNSFRKYKIFLTRPSFTSLTPKYFTKKFQTKTKAFTGGECTFFKSFEKVALANTVHWAHLYEHLEPNCVINSIVVLFTIFCSVSIAKVICEYIGETFHKQLLKSHEAAIMEKVFRTLRHRGVWHTLCNYIDWAFNPLCPCVTNSSRIAKISI